MHLGTKYIQSVLATLFDPGRSSSRHKCQDILAERKDLACGLTSQAAGRLTTNACHSLQTVFDELNVVSLLFSFHLENDCSSCISAFQLTFVCLGEEVSHRAVMLSTRVVWTATGRLSHSWFSLSQLPWWNFR